MRRGRSSSRGRLGGYTLIELLIVVAILGLAGALVVPQIGQPDELAVQAAVRRVISDLSFAQSDALAHQELRRVHFYEDGRGYVILRDPFDPATDYIYDPLGPGGAQSPYVVDFTAEDRFEGITVESAAIDGTERFVTYDELGGTLSPAGTPGTGGAVILRSTTRRYRISIAPFTGKLTVEDITN